MSDNIRYCRYCGKQIDVDSTFCTHCGKSVESSEINKNTESLVRKVTNIVSGGFVHLKYIISRIFSFNVKAEQKERVKKITKKIFKIICILALVCGIIGALIASYLYYTEEYIPNKLLDEAVANIESKFNSKEETVREEYAFNILRTDYSWGYADVPDNKINSRLYDLRIEAFKYIQDKAYSGDPKCQFALGLLYYGVNSPIQKDYSKAAYWWNEAAQQGYADAYNNVGIAYRDGIGVDADIRVAIEWLKKGAEAGKDLAQLNYGNLFKDGIKIKTGQHKETFSTAEYYFNEDHIVKKVWSDSKMTYITYYWDWVDDYEELIPKDIEQAKYWWKKSAVQGNNKAQEALQKIY